MKLKKAFFKNFRLLRELEIDFSIDPDYSLTVIRAENDSGKTTILTALQWALYGDIALPHKGKEYRIHPIDWDFEYNPKVNIEVIVEFEHTIHIPTGDAQFRESIKTYRLIRTTNEEQKGSKLNRRTSEVTLLELNSQGDTPIEPVEPILRDMLPLELREVFFTDGDRALSFIEADISTTAKRQRVQNAIKALLGLNVIENSIKHINDALSDVNRKVKNYSDSTELSDISDKLEQTTNELNDYEPKLKEITEELTQTELKLDEIEKNIATVLSRGDSEKLSKDLKENKEIIEKLEKNDKELERLHTNLFKDKSLAVNLLKPIITKAISELSILKKKGIIPRDTIPVLEERLNLKKCFCGESLDENSPEGLKRKNYLLQLIRDQKSTDTLREQLTELFYNSRNYLPESENNDLNWIEKCKDILVKRTENAEQINKARENYRNLDLQLQQLGDTDITELRRLKRHLQEQKNRLIREQERTQHHILSSKKNEKELKNKQESLLKQKKRNRKLLSELEASQDINNVLRNTYNAIINDELKKVSDAMNKYFLKMICVDPEQGAIIQKAEINKEFDIKVYGPRSRKLDPDRDLNGASRRALTLSFILALTKVSEVAAPNIIDTPLGMTSGHVKKSILETTIENSKQLVLFLTRMEIEACQDIIEKNAGNILTITNSAHYPKMLKNDPKVNEYNALRCDCNHYEYCKICERIGDESITNLSFRMDD